VLFSCHYFAIFEQGDHMPRSARQKSGSGIYHTVLRGINKQTIFEDNEDRRIFLERLITYKEISRYEIYAYCLMSNHIHLLLKEGDEDLSTVFRRIGASYVYWYNKKYNRVGHLFQDRYRSEQVETDEYLLTAMRYIHQNPTKAGIVKEIHEFPWSSYREYTHEPVICDTEFVFRLFSKDAQEALRLWTAFSQESNTDRCLEYDSGGRLNDLEAAQIIKTIANVEKTGDVKALERLRRNEVIKLLRKKGLSIRQIERLTGLSFAIIRGA
jgi:REP element-mobilizing transposase RayT